MTECSRRRRRRQRLDADVAYTQIYGMAKKSITIIYDYVGVKTLDLLRGIARGVSVTIYSDENGYESLTEQIRKDFLKARPDVKFDKKRTNDKFHDRYIFLDYGLRGKTFPLWRIKNKIRRPRAAAMLALTLPRSSILACRATMLATKSLPSCRLKTRKFIMF